MDNDVIEQFPVDKIMRDLKESEIKLYKALRDTTDARIVIAMLEDELRRRGTPQRSSYIP